MSPTLPLAIAWTAAALSLPLAWRRSRLLPALTAATLLGAGCAAAALLVTVLRSGPIEVVTGGWAPGIGIRIRADALGGFFACVSLAVLLGAYAVEWATGLLTRAFSSLVLFLAAGLLGVFLTADVFNFYVFFELSMVSSFGLAAYGCGDREIRAAAIFTVVNVIGSVLFLAGIASLYRLTGILDMPSVGAALGGREGPALLTATLLFVAFGLKLGLFPFHFWLPAVYRGTRPAVAAMLSGAVANIGSYGLLRFGGVVVPQSVEAARGVLIGIAVASILYGGLLAASRRLPSEVLGYSAVGQAGYVLLGLGIGGALGFTAAILYSAVNALNKGLLFLTGELRGRVVAAVFAFGALSVAGVPPSPGFVGKVELFRLGIGESSGWLIALVLAGAGLSFVYMFQAYQHTYWVGERQRRNTGGMRPQLVIALFALILLLLGLWPQPLLETVRQAALVFPREGA